MKAGSVRRNRQRRLRRVLCNDIARVGAMGRERARCFGDPDVSSAKTLPEKDLDECLAERYSLVETAAPVLVEKDRSCRRRAL